MPKQKKHVTKSKMSKYGNFPGLYFATFGLTAKIWFVSFHISPNRENSYVYVEYGKIGYFLYNVCSSYFNPLSASVAFI